MLGPKKALGRRNRVLLPEGGTITKNFCCKAKQLLNSYSHSLAIQSHLKLAIVPQVFPQGKLNTEQAMTIEGPLETRIGGLKLGDIILRFENCQFKNNLLTVICIDEMSRR